MKLKDHLENLNNLVKENPELLEMTVIYAKDEEGNGFDEVYYSPTIGHFYQEDKEFVSQSNITEEPEEYPEDIEMNAICIN